MRSPAGSFASARRLMAARVKAGQRSAAGRWLLVLAASALAWVTPAEAQLRTATGTYVGNGLAGGQAIAVGFAPDAVFVKGDTTQAGAASTITMGGQSKDLNLGGVLANGLITALTGTGFTVGNATIDARVNQAGVVYHWTALKAAAGELAVGTYVGNSPGGQTVAVPFQPDWVAVFGNGVGLLGCHRNSSMPGDNTVYFRNSAPVAGRIQALVPTGFQVGSGLDANDGGTTFHFIAVKNAPGRFASGVYTGDGVDNRSITGIGLVPKWVIVRHTTIARSSVQRPDTLTNDSSLTFVTTAGTPDQLQLLLSDGFQVGLDTAVNAVGGLHMWVAFGGPGGSSRTKTGKYTGNGTAGNAVDVGFQPDAVIVKRAGADPQVYAVMRTSTMTGDNTKSLSDAAPAALAPNLIQSLTATGFTVGTDNAVNTNGTEYHWIAFRSGTGEMVASTYTGNVSATQAITGLGFSPDYLIVLPPGSGTPNGIPVNATSTMPADTAHDFDNLPRSPNSILGLDPDGFRVGTGGGSQPNLNANGVVFHYVAWNAVPGKMQVGTYAGDGGDNRDLDLVGFFPEVVFVKQFPNASGEPWTYKPASTGVGADFCFRFNDGSLAPPPLNNSIQQLRPLGFQVGSNDRVNLNAATYHWVAFGPLPPQANYRSIGTRGHYGTTETDGNGSSVTATQESPFVTCAGTCLWRTFNRGRGDAILIDPGAVPYMVAAVLSENQLMLTTPYTGTSSGGKAYSIRRQFTTLQAWEDCISLSSDGGAPGAPACTFFPVASNSLVADHRSEVGIAYNDSAVPAAADFNAPVKINGGAGATTDPTHTITLTADRGNRHYGVPGAGVRVTNPGGTQTVWILDDYVTVEWLELDSTTAAGGIYAQTISPGSGTLAASRLVIRNNLVHGATGSGFGINLDDGDEAADVYNNIVYSVANSIRVVSATLFPWTQIRILNNTMYDYGGQGFDSSVGAGGMPQKIVLVNNIAIDPQGAAQPSFVPAALPNGASRNNLSSDTRAGPAFASPGGGGVINIGISDNPGVCSDPEGCVFFESCPVQAPTDCTAGAGVYNLHLRTTALTNQAINTGANLGSIFALDIDSGIRQTPWDIGADDQAATTAVTLLSFDATGLDGAVAVRWETASELQNLGFHLHRSESEGGPYARITASIIPGLGSSPTGKSYSYVDSGLVNGRRYYYKLEDVETTGKTEMHGPVWAVPVAGSGTGNPPAPPPDPGTAPSGKVYGKPEATSLTVLERTSRHVLLELRTGGFVAYPETDGTVRIEVPGFEESLVTGLPVKRAVVEAIAGRKVRLASVVASEETSYRGVLPASARRREIEVRGLGEVKVSGERFRGQRGRSELARLEGTLFQGEVKKAEVLFSPLRVERGRLVLTGRILVRLEFAGVEPQEAATGGTRGRTTRKRVARNTGGLVAQLGVNEAGLYRVTFEEVMGSRRRGIAASKLRLSRQGQAVAYHLEPGSGTFGPGSVLYFLSAGSGLNPYGEAVYELEEVAGSLQMAVVGGGASGEGLTEAVAEARFEENKYYQAGLLEANDLWQWDLVMSSSPASSYRFTLAQVSPSTTSGELVVDLQGASDFEGVSDHHLRFYLNGVPVGETSFDGKVPSRATVAVTSGVLHDGENELRIENVGDTGAAYSMVFLDRFTLRYPRLLVAEGGRFEGTFLGGGRAEVTGLSASSAVVDSTETPRWIGVVPTTSGVAFRAEAGRKYLASSTVKSPRVVPILPSTLKSVENQADYLVIGPQAFLEVAEPLLEQRRSQGLLSRAVSTEEVFQEFGHGEKTPEAIREFLEYAYQQWKRPSVRYVVLLGDATYDPKDYLKTGVKDQIPAAMVKTSYLWTASDPFYASVNGTDLVPDLAIGRLSASSVEEARVLVEKVLAWESSGQSLGGAAALVADNPDLAGDFEGNANEIASTILSSRNPQRIFLREQGAQTRPAIHAALDGGLSLLSYVGHGGTVIWASENVFNFQDVSTLALQPQQPLLLTMNCLNGFFHFPPLNSLAEALVKAEGKGAIAAFSPSGLSLNDAAHIYHKALLAEIVSGRHPRLGDAVLAAQAAYADSGAFPELLSIYHLFGDPALKIQ